MDLKTLVGNGNVARIERAMGGILTYTIHIGTKLYSFPVDMNDKDDVGTATFDYEIKAITLMRYIRKALANNTLDESGIINYMDMTYGSAAVLSHAIAGTLYYLFKDKGDIFQLEVKMSDNPEAIYTPVLSIEGLDKSTFIKIN